MNSQEFRQAARTTFALAMDAYYAVSNNNDATMEELIAADAAKTAADAQWIADQHTANTMAQAELDAATAKGCEEVVEGIDASYDDQAIDEALDAIREAVSAGESYARLVTEAEELGVSRFVISDVIATAKAELDAATAKVCEEVVEVVSEEVTKPITAMTPAEQVALSQDRAKEANIRWDEINAYAATVMNAHKPSANLVALRKYLAE